MEKKKDIKIFAEGGKELARIRRLIALNLSLGVFVVLVASGGRYL